MEMNSRLNLLYRHKLTQYFLYQSPIIRWQRVVNELLAIGIKNTVLVYDDKEDLILSSFPSKVEKVDRTKLNEVQVKLSKIKGVTAIVYVQTCKFVHKQ